MTAHDVRNFRQDAESNLSIVIDLLPGSNAAAVVVAYYVFESAANAIAAAAAANSSAAVVVASRASTVDSADLYNGELAVVLIDSPLYSAVVPVAVARFAYVAAAADVVTTAAIVVVVIYAAE